MPKKSKKLASRQAELSGRGKRVRRHGPSGFPGNQTPVAPPVPRPTTNKAILQEEVSTHPIDEQVQTTQVDSRRARAPQTRSRSMAPRSPALYFKQEARRIGIVTGIILLAMIALTILL
ncbi:MAG: hypothetical protein BZY82_00080 [SAR202 cluster bacterium Io17-Chloro-G3]|nr:MAG: hypothetical protein BZY82_00080 [SAR202 cluster bacterium Io17-Chloro-G3]